jgi:hypothetical protein
MKLGQVLIGFALAILLEQATTHAAFILSIEDVDVVAGSQAVVGVFISSPDSDRISAYNFPIEVGNNGRGFPTGFSFSPGDFAQEVGTFSTVNITGITNLPAPNVQNYEAVFSDNGANIQLSTTRLRLFNILFDTSSTLAVGTTVPLSFNSNSTPNFFSVTTTLGGTVNAVPANSVGGSIRIAAVPEPSSMVLLAVVAVLGSMGAMILNRKTCSFPVHDRSC